MKDTQAAGQESHPAVTGKVVVPDVVGLDASEATMRLESAGLKIQANGRGTAISQSESPHAAGSGAGNCYGQRCRECETDRRRCDYGLRSRRRGSRGSSLCTVR